jgi:hypothetical protein
MILRKEDNMISDVLCEAIWEIEECQKEFGDSYDELRMEIEKVKAVMDAMRAYLDILPVGEFEKGGKGLLQAIRELDTTSFAKPLVEIRGAFVRAKRNRERGEPEQAVIEV